MALTQKDLWAIEELIEEKLEEKLDEKIKGLPTKDEFYTKMDEVMGELKAIREEQAAMFHRLSDREDRISGLEDIHPGGAHSA